jgi:phosphosulfolactate synthase (CoM biosynthesis protein A)
MPLYWVAIQFDGASELGVEANDLTEAVEEGKIKVLEALHRGIDLWVARANEPGKAPGYLSEQMEVKWRPIDDITGQLGGGNN